MIRRAAACLCLILASSALADPVPDPFAELAHRLLPSVVNISTSQNAKPEAPVRPPAEPGPASPFDEFFKDFFDHQGGGAPHGRKAIALGSGFIIDASGLVVTNNHVIADADEITVILQDDTNIKAELVGRDPKTDLALLRVKTDHPLVAVPWGDSDQAKVGDWVLAIGNPFGLGGTATGGILSAKAREINGGGPYDDFLQTDASINRGNSGGPLFNTKGQVIGINSAIFSPSGGSIGIGFAIPSDLASHVIDQFRDFGHVRRGYLGAEIQSVGPEVARDLGLDAPTGVLIADVLKDSPAAAAGIKPGDVILTMGGKPIADTRHLQRAVAEAAIDQDTPVKLWRQNATQTVELKVTEAKEPEQVATVPKKEQKPLTGGSEVKALGLTLAPVTPDLKDRFQLDDNASVVVTGVAAGGPAADKDLKPGDVVVEVAQEAVKGLDDITRKVDEAHKAGRKSVLMLIDRGGDLRFVAVRIDRG